MISTDPDERPLPAKLPKVGVVILNYNGKSLAEQCIRSVLNSGYPEKEIILVDNASTDGSLDYFRGLFPDVYGLANKENLGIAGGRNQGFIEAIRRGADYVLSLDNDTRIEPVLDYLCLGGERREIYFLWRPFLRDPGDEMVLEVAVGARVATIVTHNVRDFAGVQERFGIRVATPGEVLRELEES